MFSVAWMDGKDYCMMRMKSTVIECLQKQNMSWDFDENHAVPMGLCYKVDAEPKYTIPPEKLGDHEKQVC